MITPIYLVTKAIEAMDSMIKYGIDEWAEIIKAGPQRGLAKKASPVEFFKEKMPFMMTALYMDNNKIYYH